MSVAQFMIGPGLAGISQLLDEHHLVVLGDEAPARRSFARTVATHLSGFPGAQVLSIPAGAGHNLDAFGESIFAALGLAGRPRSLDDVIEALRDTNEGVRMRFMIWHEADEMLERNVELFGRVTQALLAVAAEHEHLNPDPLVLHRVIFIGGDKLGAYAEEEKGQFCCWRSDDGPWNADAVGHVPRPPVMTYRL